ncbi:PREDICTED: RNA polymerase sigma factor sigC [Nelumbo nucifera]|uniref:RNA polymerase sigma factor sigC n=1 Tax=Nelumbo nucifera TaxID=4432 RepID=A0A1U7YXW5_NELNU|nr:PREDICTED: RNA polymerase sigma factor sigC [Nelumbo nucifera]XP_010244379.1 PREDICTED: RNA polymerase sigma factor sigC [Nelumbo nucifera]
MGFGLDWKWVFPVQSHLLSHSSTRNHSSFVRSREAYFESARMSFLSVIPEESETLQKDPLKAYACSSGTLQPVNNGYAAIGVKMNTSKEFHNSLYDTFEDISIATPEDSSAFLASLQARKISCFSLLMENVEKIEDIFVSSDLIRLEKGILVQLEKLGALNLFHACLSRTVKVSSALNLHSALKECSKKYLMDGEMSDHVDHITVPSRRKEERKLRRERESKRASKKPALKSSPKCGIGGPQQSTISIAKRPASAKSRRLMIARNESEMSRAVKEVSCLERIRSNLEEELGRVISFSSWAEAVGLDEKELQQRLHFGWYCRDKLLRSTRSLVVYLARNYRGLGIAFEDLLQAGNFGVLQGAERFDHTRGYRFSTYVQYWIRKSMSTLVAQHSRGVHIPLTLSRAINQIHKTRKSFFNTHGRYPDDDEISKCTGLSVAKVRLAGKCLRVVGSIDQKMGDSLTVKFMEFMPDTSIKTPEDIVMRQHMRKDIHKLLQGLHPRERKVLVLRYGLCDGRCRSLEEIGRLFNVTKEWIRKIEKAAMTKVRTEEVQRNLSEYLHL